MAKKNSGLHAIAAYCGFIDDARFSDYKIWEKRGFVVVTEPMKKYQLSKFYPYLRSLQFKDRVIKRTF